MQYSVYRVRLQSSKGCFPLPLVQLSGYQIQAIIRGICFSSIACAVFSLPSTVIIIQGMPSPTARASRLDTGNYPRDTLFQHCLCSLQSTKYGYIRHGQSSRGCTLPALLMQSAVYRVRLYQTRAIIQGMRSFGIGCAVFRLPSTVTIIRGMPLSTARAVIGLADTGNHPRDALFRHCLCNF